MSHARRMTACLDNTEHSFCAQLIALTSVTTDKCSANVVPSASLSIIVQLEHQYLHVGHELHLLVWPTVGHVNVTGIASICVSGVDFGLQSGVTFSDVSFRTASYVQRFRRNLLKVTMILEIFKVPQVRPKLYLCTRTG